MSLKVYKASAGSGKTFKLALEYITLALITDNPKAFTHILAVTFTNKATAEMKERILTQLYKLANNIPDRDFQSQLMATTGQTAETLRERAGRVLETIVHDFDHFRVETIDSFFQSTPRTWRTTWDSRVCNFRVSLDTNGSDCTFGGANVACRRRETTFVGQTDQNHFGLHAGAD